MAKMVIFGGACVKDDFKDVVDDYRGSYNISVISVKDAFKNFPNGMILNSLESKNDKKIFTINDRDAGGEEVSKLISEQNDIFIYYINAAEILGDTNPYSTIRTAIQDKVKSKIKIIVEIPHVTSDSIIFNKEQTGKQTNSTLKELINKYDQSRRQSSRNISLYNSTDVLFDGEQKQTRLKASVRTVKSLIETIIIPAGQGAGRDDNGTIIKPSNSSTNTYQQTLVYDLLKQRSGYCTSSKNDKTFTTYIKDQIKRILDWNSAAEPVLREIQTANQLTNTANTQAAPTPDTDAEQKRREEEERKILLSSKIRLNEQAALMMHADEIITKKPENAGKEWKSQNKKEYTNFATYRGDNSQSRDVSGGHTDFFSKIFQYSETAQLLKDIPTHILSSLTPAIKVFKVFYPEEKLFYPNSDGISWRIPFDEISFPFSRGKDNLTSAFLDTSGENGHRETLANLLRGENKLFGAGIKSFRYKYVGTNPAEVNTNIEADLEIYLQDVRDLVKPIKVPTNDPNFIDKSTLTKELNFSYVDLVADVPSKYRDNSDREVYNTDYYRIKIMVGYSVPPDKYLKELLPGVQDEKLKSIKNALENATVYLYLNPYNHDISFEENGAITLKIQYIAAMTTQTSALNCLEVAHQTYSKYKEAQKKLEDELKQKAAELKKIFTCAQSTTERDTSSKAVDKKYEKALEKEKTDIEMNKNSIYSELFGILTGLKRTAYGKSCTVYMALFDAASLGVTNGGKLSEDRQVKKGLRKNLISSFTSTSDSSQFFLTQAPKIEKSKDNDTTKADEKAKEAYVKEDLASLREGLNPFSDGTFGVKYVFLGDVFEVFCDIIREIKHSEDIPRIILNNFTLELPVNSIEDEIQYKKFTFNIADVPISLEMLKYFFMERMVKSRRSSYNLFTLLSNLLSDVVTSAVSPRYFGTNSVLNRSVRISMLGISVPRTQNVLKDPICDKPLNHPAGGILTSNKLKNKKLSQNFNISNHSNICNYLIMYCSNQLPYGLQKNNGDVDLDEEIGVYHVYIGSDRGLIKKINFSRNNTPFYKEAKNQSSQGIKSLGRLQEVYDVSVSMFGNNIYKPGDYFYVEPLIMSGKEAVDLQNKIGLGGYYQVIDVETKLDSGNYETTLHGVLYGRVVKDENSNDKTIPLVPERAC